MRRITLAVLLLCASLPAQTISTANKPQGTVTTEYWWRNPANAARKAPAPTINDVVYALMRHSAEQQKQIAQLRKDHEEAVAGMAEAYESQQKEIDTLREKIAIMEQQTDRREQ